MSNDENASKQDEADASPNKESGHVEGAPNANNPPLTASPNDPFLHEKRKYQLDIEQLKLELARKERDNVRKQNILERKLATVKDSVASQRNHIAKLEADRRAVETEIKAKLRGPHAAINRRR